MSRSLFVFLHYSELMVMASQRKKKALKVVSGLPPGSLAASNDLQHLTPPIGSPGLPNCILQLAREENTSELCLWSGHLASEQVFGHRQ